MGPSLALLLLAGPARAQTFPGAREYAAAVVALTTPKWKGQVVQWPERHPRPVPGGYTLQSQLWPLSVHAGRDVPLARAQRALTALEAARQVLDQTGWPQPLPDGGLGGTGGFDLYLAPLDGDGADAFSDGPVTWSFWDAVSSFGVVDPDTCRVDLDACVTSAYVQAALLGQAPAEARSWREATGAYVAWLVTGSFGCDDPIADQQEHPWRAWIGSRGDAPDPEGGALMLAMLSARHDGGTGTFVRDLWQLARQRSAGIADLRGSPDMWQALQAVLKVTNGHRDSEPPLDEAMEDLAVQRYFTGRHRESSTPWYLSELGPNATVPVTFETQWTGLPQHAPPADPALEPFGSAYALVDVSTAPADGVLRVWLRGEYGVQWSLVAVRLNATGEPLERVTAPARDVPDSYVPVQLDSKTKKVLIVVTNLSSRLPDADIPDENVRSFELIVDRGDQKTALGKGG